MATTTTARAASPPKGEAHQGVAAAVFAAIPADVPAVLAAAAPLGQAAVAVAWVLGAPTLEALVSSPPARPPGPQHDALLGRILRAQQEDAARLAAALAAGGRLYFAPAVAETHMCFGSGALLVRRCGHVCPGPHACGLRGYPERACPAFALGRPCPLAGECRLRHVVGVSGFLVVFGRGTTHPAAAKPPAAGDAAAYAQHASAPATHAAAQAAAHLALAATMADGGNHRQQMAAVNSLRKRQREP